MDAAKKYEYIKTLGEGSYGHVWLCRDRERDCLVAIKKFKDANKDSQAYHLAMREIKLLRATSHEHVVSVIEAFRSQSSGNVYLVMEYAESCLNLELKKHRTGLPTADVMRITWQLASALQYLHSRKIVHRDLKPANILLTAACDLKLCDFGFARDLPPAGQQADMSSYVTTRWYRAPEVVVGADYGAAVDIWALGCLFAELLNGQPLFPGASNMDQLALIVACFGHLPNRLLAKALTNPQLVGVQLRTGNPRNWAVALQQRFAPYGENAVTLLLSCLNPDPLKRATADEVLRAPYFEPIRQKKVPSLNGPPSIAITVTTAAVQPAASAVPLTLPPPAVPPAAFMGPMHPAAVIQPAAVAAVAAAADANYGSAPAIAASARICSEASQLQQPKQQQQHPPAAQVQQPLCVVTPSTDGARLTSKEMEPQPERPAPVVTVHAVAAPLPVGAPAAPAVEAGGHAPAPAPAGANAEYQTARAAPVHPALVEVPRQVPGAEASAKDGELEAGLGSGSGPRPANMEVETPPAAPAPPNAAQVQRQTSQVRFLPPTLPSFGHGQAQGQVQGDMSVAPSLGMRQLAAQAAFFPGGGALHDATAGGEAARLQQQQQRDARAPAVSLQQMRASVASIPMSGMPMGARPLTDTGMGIPGIVQVPTPVLQGKAGATLAQHTKRASEHSIGMYGNHRGPGAAAGCPSDMPMRLARVSLVNPNLDPTQLPQENNNSTSSSPSTTPNGAAAAAAIAVAGVFSGGSVNASIISPAGSLTAGGVAAIANGVGGCVQYGASGAGRRRSTATGSRLTRVSHTCEGQDPQLRDEDSEDDNSGERLSLLGSNVVAGNAPVSTLYGSASQPSPRRRHSRLASVTEPGGQYPPGSIVAAGAATPGSCSSGGAAPAAASTVASVAADGGGFDHLGPGGGSGGGAPNRGPSAPQMLSPLGRTAHLLSHHGASAISAGSGPVAGPTQGSLLHISDSGPHQGTTAHGPLHTTMSAVSLNVLGVGAAAREREREAPGEAGGTLRSNALVGIATPAAPTASQRSFTSQTVSTSAAAAGLMSRPVSNLYINVGEHGTACAGFIGRAAPAPEPAENATADWSAAASPSTPTGGAGGGALAAAPAASAFSTASAASAATASSRRTTFTDGPTSMFKSVLRTLSTRRSTSNSSQSGVPEHQPAATASASAAAAATAAQPTAFQPTNSIGGVPPAPSHLSLSLSCGTALSQSSASSAAVSPFIPSRVSSHNFITGAPPERAVPVEASSSLTLPGGGSEDHATAAAALRRSVTVNHGAGGGVIVGGGARIGLPHLNVRIPETTIGGGPATIGNGYGSAVVSPAGRRRSQLAAQPARTSDAGMVIGSAVLRQTSSGSVSMQAGHPGCKPATSALHAEMVGVPGLVGGGGVSGGGSALPVVRSSAAPAEGPSAHDVRKGR